MLFRAINTTQKKFVYKTFRKYSTKEDKDFFNLKKSPYLKYIFTSLICVASFKTLFYLFQQSDPAYKSPPIKEKESTKTISKEEVEHIIRKNERSVGSYFKNRFIKRGFVLSSLPK